MRRHPPHARSHRLAFSSLFLAVTVSSCAGALNFSNPEGPIFQGNGRPSEIVIAGVAEPNADSEPDRLRVVSFNIKFSKEIDRAVDLFLAEPELRNADLVLLQEMEENDVARIAEALGFYWVYSPATLHPKCDCNFGNAILSRTPLSDPRKLILPHLGRLNRTQRIATSATIDLAGVPVRVYSVHLATMIELGPGSRREQVEAILADADSLGGAVVIGGDFNSKGLGKHFEADGYEWLTRDVGKTCALWSFDHVFTRGLPGASGALAGKIADNRGASDHKPIWVTMTMPGGGVAPTGDAGGPNGSGAGMAARSLPPATSGRPETGSPGSGH